MYFMQSNINESIHIIRTIRKVLRKVHDLLEINTWNNPCLFVE